MTQHKANPSPEPAVAVTSLHYLIDKAIAAARRDQQALTIESMEAASRARTKAIKAALATPTSLPAAQAVEGVEADAARYRWLRTPPNNLNPAVYGPTSGLLRRDNYLDDAIDQALAAASQGDRGKT